MSDLLKLLPKKIKISFADVDVKTTNDVKFTDDFYGEYSSRENKITIANGIQDKDMANTVLHELVHAAVWYGGLKDEGSALEDDKNEEHVVNIVTNQLCQIFRDNPTLLTIIDKGLKNRNGRTKKRDQAVALHQKTLEKHTFHKNRK
tara:strand:+ start:85 stop:525 length:441 start_codon:yes stop_codon:yes gene_type:complete